MTRGQRRYSSRHLSVIISATAWLIASLGLVVPSAMAAEPLGAVREISIESVSVDNSRSTLELDFDSPIPQVEASEARQRLGSEPPVQRAQPLDRNSPRMLPTSSLQIIFSMVQ